MEREIPVDALDSFDSAASTSAGGFSVTTDPELTQLYAKVRRASDELVKRLEFYEELVPARANEAAVADEVVGFARFAERQFRGWYERCRDIREMLEDPGLRSLPGSRRPDADPRGD
jgi:hypothetical protein